MNSVANKRERDPIATKKKIKEAVGEILRTQGYPGIYLNNIAKHAGVTTRLVSYYFENLDNLVKEYLTERDYWLTFGKRLEDAIASENTGSLEELLNVILVAHYECFELDEEMRKFITWEISEYTDLLRRESEIREAFGEVIFKKAEPYFSHTNINIRSMMAIMTAGIYYMILHAKTNGSTFCGIDINKPEGREDIMTAIKQILGFCFEKAEEKLNK